MNELDFEPKDDFWMMRCDDCRKCLGIFSGWGTDVETRLCLNCAISEGCVQVKQVTDEVNG